MKLLIAHTIIEELRAQHPDIKQIDNERGDIWLPGGSTSQSSGCIVDVHSIAQAVETEVCASLAVPASGSGDHAELARLAEAATPGPWRVAEDDNPFADGRHVFAKGLDGSDFVVLNLKTDLTFVTATNREQQQKNALFAAAANPAAVLAILEENAALRGEVETLTTAGK